MRWEIGQPTFNTFHPFACHLLLWKDILCKRKQQKIRFVPLLTHKGNILEDSPPLDVSNLDIKLDYDNNEYISL